MSNIATATFAPHLTVPAVDTTPALAPEVEAAIRTARALARQKDAIDEAADAAKRLKAAELGLKGSISGLEKRERDARAEVGRLVGATTVASLDGETLAIEIGERGGGNPDYAAAWEQVKAAMTPDWQRFMEETLGGCVTKAQQTVKITPVPVATAPAPLRVVPASSPAPVASLPAAAPAPAAPRRAPRAKGPTLQ